jgi:site-specific DNA recombinase
MSLEVKAAAIYVRISSDPTGTAAGVARQHQDCQEWASRNRTVVAAVYEDNDRSAYNGKPRPQYRLMCEAIKRGDIDGVIVWHPDRLHRSPKELEDFIELIEAAGAEYHSVTGGDYDLSTPQGRMFARMLGAVARHESEDKSRRITRKAQELAQQGKRNGGGHRPYGYNAAHDKVIKKEAAVIQEAAKRIIAGDTLRSICQDFNDRKIPTVKGGQWSPTVLRTILCSGRISGQRDHHGAITSSGDWPSVISTTETARLRTILQDPSRRATRPPRSYPLTGLVFCARCGSKMVARPREDGARRYICPSPRDPGTNGCGKTYVLSEPLETFITEAVLHRLDSPQVARAIRGQLVLESSVAELELRLEDDRNQLDELAAMWGRKELSTNEWDAAKAPIQQRIREAEKQLGRSPDATALDGFIGNADALRSQWASLSAHRQRAIVAALIDSISIGPAVRGRNTFDPGRVFPTWKA